MPRGVYKRKSRKMGAAPVAAPGGETAVADPVREAMNNETIVDTNTNRDELVRLLRVERDKQVARLKVIDVCIRMLEQQA